MSSPDLPFDSLIYYLVIVSIPIFVIITSHKLMNRFLFTGVFFLSVFIVYSYSNQLGLFTWGLLIFGVIYERIISRLLGFKTY